MKQTLLDPIPCFIPMWTNAINFAQLADNKNKIKEKLTSATLIISEKFDMQYSDCPSCLVGEAHTQLGKGTEDTYTNHGIVSEYCAKCSFMCGNQALVAVNRGGDTLIKFKIKLYNHMVEAHGFKGKQINLKKLQKVGKC